MAAQNATIVIPVANTWTIISAGAASAARVENVCGYEVIIGASATTTPPVDTSGGVYLLPYNGFSASETLASLFPGVASAAYLFAWCAVPGGRVSVSHA